MIEQRDAIRAFVGPAQAVARIMAVVPDARAFALLPGAALFVVPLTDDVHAGMHATNGTGEWIDLESGGPPVLLTTSDLAFAARISVRSAMAFVAVGAAGDQMAAAWIDGVAILSPVGFGAGDMRPRSLSPVNVALRHLGVKVAAGEMGDERAMLGLDRYGSNDDVIRRAAITRL